MTTTKAKKKINRKPLNYLLCAVQRNDAGDISGFSVLPQPVFEKEGKPTRDDYKRAVRKGLEEGRDDSEFFNNKELTVVGFPEPFRLNAEVEEVVVRKVKVSEA